MLKRIIDNEYRLLLFVGVVAAVVLLRIAVAFNINWDEFNYLSLVYDYLGGRLEMRLQTFHVHAFTWLPAVSANEVNQIVAARLVMLLLHGLTAFYVYRIAARATDRPSALFATLAYLSLSYVIRGGASFRYDPIAITLIMAAFDLVVFRKPDLRRAALGGALMATAAMVTIKAAIFLPSFLIFLALPLFGARRPAHSLGSLVTGVLAALAAFSILFALHDLSLVSMPMDASNIAAAGFEKTVLDAGFFPRISFFLTTLKIDFVIWAFLVAGIVLSSVKIWQSRGEGKLKWLVLAVLAAPLATLLVYRNAFPYYYGFLLAPPAVLIAVAWQALGNDGFVGRTGLLSLGMKVLAILYLLFNLIVQGVLAPQVKPLAHQRQILRAVHRVFADPVPYFSRTTLVASFPQVGFFMSTWGMENYRAVGERVFVRAITERAPPLLIADHPLLDLENKVYPPLTNQGHELFEEDRTALDATYIHHWGPIYVAGLRTRIRNQKTVEVMIGGRYTLEAGCSIEIDGRRIAPGESIVLARGPHELTATEGFADIALRWGDKLYHPDNPPADLPLFLGF